MSDGVTRYRFEVVVTGPPIMNPATGEPQFAIETEHVGELLQMLTAAVARITDSTPDEIEVSLRRIDRSWTL